MAATGVLCPICGALLVHEYSLHDAAAGESPWLGRCENQHWWLQLLMFGWIPIDPGAMTRDGPTMTEDERLLENALVPRAG